MIDSAEKTKKIQEIINKLTPAQKLFCENYVSKEFYGNGVQSYIDAYNVDLTQAGGYDSAKAGAYENLTKLYLLDYINSMLDEAGLNDAFVDKQLVFLITQNAEFPSKIAAIKEYNKLKSRITDKIKHEGEVTLRNWNVEPVKPADESK